MIRRFIMLTLKIQNPKNDGGKSYWNKLYLKVFYLMATKLRCFQVLDKQILDKVEICPSGSAVDIGVGPGRLIVKMAKALRIHEGMGTLYLIDYTEHALGLARQNANSILQKTQIEFLLQDMANLQIGDNTVDAGFDIFASCYDNWKDAVPELLRVVKPGGYIYLNHFIYGSDFAECFKNHVIDEFKYSPSGVFWALFLKILYLRQWDRYIKDGSIVYPTPEELAELVKQNGAEIIVQEPAFWETCTFIKAKKL